MGVPAPVDSKAAIVPLGGRANPENLSLFEAFLPASLALQLVESPRAPKEPLSLPAPMESVEDPGSTNPHKHATEKEQHHAWY